MTAKQEYWIADPNGVHALVEGVEERNLWTQARGWHEAGEPVGDMQVRVVNGDLGGCIPFGALEAGWADMGWKPGPPAAVVDVYRDPAPVVEQPPVEESAPKTKAAAGSPSKEN